jgi:hypothetical protein
MTMDSGASNHQATEGPPFLTSHVMSPRAHNQKNGAMKATTACPTNFSITTPD